MKKTLIALAGMLLLGGSAWAKDYVVKSPNGQTEVTVSADNQAVTYAVTFNGQQLVKPSAISVSINNGKKVLAPKTVKSAKVTAHTGTIKAEFYKKAEVQDNYGELTIQFKEGIDLNVRAYDDGAAYRFTTKQPKAFTVDDETATFGFAKDWLAYVPYSTVNGTIEEQFNTSFENTYKVIKLTEWNKAKSAFLPIVVEADNNVKVVVSESDLENYPGLFLYNPEGSTALQGVSAKYPAKVEQGGHNNLQLLVRERENYLAKREAGFNKLPWRVLSFSTADEQLLNDDMVYRLAEPSRLAETDWIKPGKVAWDWWNCWGVYNVPFRGGVNNETYKYYIDFASQYGIEYVILDEGWAVNKKADLFQIVPEIDLKGLVDYAAKKNVGIILWAGYYAFERDMEKTCKTYSEMGVKGFKVDFMNRDDAALVDFIYRASATAAKYHMLMDFHGMYKPTGLSRTYPNVLNYEGVKGLENTKWDKLEDYDHVTYDCIIPFARMLAGSMDYTQGAMLNSTKGGYRPNYYEPMSQGTRCRQLAQYAIFMSPLNMLCDSPTHYEKEPECAKFIADFPCVWDETVPLKSRISEYVAVARRSGNTWYVGAITNWTGRKMTLDLSALGVGGKKAEVFRDGLNTNRIPSEYIHETITVPADGKVDITMQSGGGYVMKIVK